MIQTKKITEKNDILSVLDAIFAEVVGRFVPRDKLLVDLFDAMPKDKIENLQFNEIKE